jgi:hypothetical protein
VSDPFLGICKVAFSSKNIFITKSFFQRVFKEKIIILLRSDRFCLIVGKVSIKQKKKLKSKIIGQLVKKTKKNNLNFGSQKNEKEAAVAIALIWEKKL